LPTKQAKLYSELSRLSAASLEKLDDEDIHALNLLLKARLYDHKDKLCGRVEVDARGFASEQCGPLYWLQNLTKTLDDHAAAKGTPAKMPFPRKSYFRPLMGALLRPVLNPSPECQTTFFPKSRELMTSWTICGYLGWLCQWRPGTLAVVQTLKETKAQELVRYVTILAENQEPFLQERYPLTRSTAMEIEWANGSRVFGIPGGEHQIRMFHPSVAVFDEIGFMEDGESCFNAVLPVAKQIIGVSSAHASWFGDECSL
jgi:hypothetical protein